MPFDIWIDSGVKPQGEGKRAFEQWRLYTRTKSEAIRALALVLERKDWILITISRSPAEESKPKEKI